MAALVLGPASWVLLFFFDCSCIGESREVDAAGETWEVLRSPTGTDEEE